MFFDISPLELMTLIIMAIVIFGPDKLPKLIQDTMGFIRKVRAFADNAKQDIREELGPDFKDFEFEDLHPKTFVRKQLLGGNDDPLGFKELKDDLDIRTALNGEPAVASVAASAAVASPIRLPDSGPPLAVGERPPFDPDAT